MADYSGSGQRNDYDSQTDTSDQTEPILVYVVITAAFWTFVFCLCRTFVYFLKSHGATNTRQNSQQDETRAQAHIEDIRMLEYEKPSIVCVHPSGSFSVGFSIDDHSNASAANPDIQLRPIELGTHAQEVH